MYIIHLKPDQPEALPEAMKGGGATKRVSSTIYNIPSTYTGENFGLLNVLFRNFCVTHKKIDNSNHQADMVHYFFHLLSQYKDDSFLREIQKELRIREKQD